MLTLLAMLQADVSMPKICAWDAYDKALPPLFAAWTKPGTVLSLGGAADLYARPIDEFKTSVAAEYVPIPAQPGAVATARVRVTEAGRYVVGLNVPATVNLHAADGSREAPMIAPGRTGNGPACSTIKLIAGFQLTPGDYFVVVSGLKPRMRVRAIFAKPRL